MRKRIVAGFFLAFAAYVAGYGVLRSAATTVLEVDGCPTQGCRQVSFRGDGPYALFAPMLMADKLLNPQTTFSLVLKD